MPEPTTEMPSSGAASWASRKRATALNEYDHAAAQRQAVVVLHPCPAIWSTIAHSPHSGHRVGPLQRISPPWVGDLLQHAELVAQPLDGLGDPIAS